MNITVDEAYLVRSRTDRQLFEFQVIIQFSDDGTTAVKRYRVRPRKGRTNPNVIRDWQFMPQMDVARKFQSIPAKINVKKYE